MTETTAKRAETITAYHGTVHAADMVISEFIPTIPNEHASGAGDEWDEVLLDLPAVYCSEYASVSNAYCDVRNPRGKNQAGEVGFSYEVEITGVIINAMEEEDCGGCGGEHEELTDALNCVLPLKPDAIRIRDWEEVVVINPAAIRIVGAIRMCGCDHLIDGEIQPACECNDHWTDEEEIDEEW